MTFKEVLHKFRAESFTEREKGDKFEKLMRSWLLTDKRFNELRKVWLWEEFPGRKDFGGSDIGIDLVAKTDRSEYWAIQCKCYNEKTVIDKAAVDSFIAASGKRFTDAETSQTVYFSHRMWIDTAGHWGKNAEETITNQDPKVNRIGLYELETSPVEWNKLLEGIEGKAALKKGKQLRKHQLIAMSKAHEHYQTADRGKLIMACGTGKTFTSLRLVEQELNNKGLVLFMVPSIALLGQTLNEWHWDAQKPIKSVCICSDNKVQRSTKKKNDTLDTLNESTVDLALPATTDVKHISQRLCAYREHEGLVVVFSTYQSIDAISKAQKQLLKDTNGEYGVFDFIVCDEAHRTTGVHDAEREGNFTKIHSNDNVQGKKRLYMTATPRLYKDNAKSVAQEKDLILCSMDDESLYGKEFYRVNFSYAVQNGLLTDYKVFVLTVDENDVTDSVHNLMADSNETEYNYDDTAKLIGVISGLSKKMKGDNGQTWEADPRMMRRALAFCSAIGNTNKPGTSVNVSKTLPTISQMVEEDLDEAERKRTVTVSARHIDGSMNASQRNEILAWLKDDSEDERECRVVTNVRCLSEGVDVPALDAVLFLSARNSQVDVVQSVGRVMRNFRKGQTGEKKYGYIIIPIVTPAGVSAEKALNNSKTFDVVWSILNALRSHDDSFNAEVNKINLNKGKSEKILVGSAGIGTKSGDGDLNDRSDAQTIDNKRIATELSLRFKDYETQIYAKLVEKCGDRFYWENWAKQVGVIATKFIERIAHLVGEGDKYEKDFDEFLKGLQQSINPSVDRGQAIEMLAQHMICRPVFDALFEEYEFVKNNAVSSSMQLMIEILQDEAFEKDTEILDKFYDSVKMNIGKLDNLEAKQTVIKHLYEQFFKGAFPKTVDRLGIVYTPVECVDFIIHSVDDILKREFGTSLTEENVHILDPFTGTGTFITRLLQSGCIKDKDLERKYLKEIHCNELVLLAYYVADVNIESVFHERTHRKEYLPYDGICLTDTFQLNEDGDRDIFSQLFKENNVRVDKQKKSPVRVIIGNPPYSVGQKSANDNAQNLKYEKLDKSIADTYAKYSSAGLGKSTYDSYIKAFRWSSDRIDNQKEGGIVAFISNGSWLDGNAQDGFRQCIEQEFTDIYVLNLRGNCRTSGEMRRKEGDGVFGLGSRTQITITFLIQNPSKHQGKGNKAKIHYHDIGDYLTREQKLALVKDFYSISSMKLQWETIVPNEKNDWINQRGGKFDELVPLFPEKKFTLKSESFFSTYIIGVATNRDAWVTGFSKNKVSNVMSGMIDIYNKHCDRTSNIDIFDYSEDEISWTRALKNNAMKSQKVMFDETSFRRYAYRPFCMTNIYYQKHFIESPGLWDKICPSLHYDNFLIGVSGVGQQKPFASFMTNIHSDLQVLDKAQYFPLYYYEEEKKTSGMEVKGTQKVERRLMREGKERKDFRTYTMNNMFDSQEGQAQEEKKYIRHDGITDWILKEVRKRYATKSITKEQIFYYVYGLLHSENYRREFEADLKKSLPRIPIVEKLEDFIAFEKAGRSLADLHLNYEHVDRHSDVKVINSSYEMPAEPIAPWEEESYGMAAEQPSVDEYKTYHVTQMRFAKKQGVDKNGKPKKVDDKSVIIYNENIRLENIPEKAYEYVVNGKSAVEWIMERYCVKTDSKSGITNDANDWGREHGKPRYIIDLLLSVISVSCQTVDIVKGLPKLKF